jgi:LacI family transcriptional regulator
MTRRPTPLAPPAPPSRAARASSLDDVAHLAGVSSGTVSRTLSKPEMVSEATRARVMAAADRLGYVANGAARALAMRRTMTVGAIVPRFGSSSFPAMVQALETTLAAAGYTLLLSAPDPQPAHETAVLRALLERGVDAVAGGGAGPPPAGGGVLAGPAPAVMALLAAHATPFVMMWAPPAADGHSVGFDEALAASLVVDHLAEFGHMRIGYVGGNTRDSERARRRLHDLTLAIAKRGLTLCADALLETEHGFREGFDAMTQILDRGTRATAIVCGSDYLAAGALSALAGAGVAVPGTLSVASFNDNEFAPFLHPPLTTVRLPIREMGERAGAYLVARLRAESPAAQKPLGVQLQKRLSTGPAARFAKTKPARR